MNKQERSNYDLSPQLKTLGRELVQKAQKGDKAALKKFNSLFTEPQIEVMALDVLNYPDMDAFKKSLRGKN